MGQRFSTVSHAGAGCRPLVVALAGYDVTVPGSNPSRKERLAFLTAGRSVKISFVAGDLVNLPFRERSFEVVVSLRLLPHVNRWRRLMRELTCVAREAVLIDYPSLVSVNLAIPLLFDLKKVERNTRPFLRFTGREVSDAFLQNGYIVSAAKPEFFLAMALHRALGKLCFSEQSERLFEILGLTRLLESPVLVLAQPRLRAGVACLRNP